MPLAETAFRFLFRVVNFKKHSTDSSWSLFPYPVNGTVALLINSKSPSLSETEVTQRWKAGVLGPVLDVQGLHPVSVANRSCSASRSTWLLIARGQSSPPGDAKGSSVCLFGHSPTLIIGWGLSTELIPMPHKLPWGSYGAPSCSIPLGSHPSLPEQDGGKTVFR